MPNAVSLLMADHRTVERLFAQFHKTGSATTARRICKELRVHTTLEEEIVYPVLERDVDRGMAREAKKEHREAKKLIAKIEGMRSAAGGQLTSLMTQLEQAVTHHVEEEETEVFPAMRSEVGNQLTAMGREIESRKKTLTSAARGARTTTTATTKRTRRSATTSRATTKSRTTRRTAPGGRRAPARSTLIDLTRDELMQKAERAGVTGRSRMTKAELADALSRGGRSTRR